MKLIIGLEGFQHAEPLLATLQHNREGLWNRQDIRFKDIHP